jgi:hypothetical protein
VHRPCSGAGAGSTAAAALDAACHALLTHLRAFDAAGGWHRQGALSCAHWLSWRTGLDLHSAREKVRVAKTLGALPLVDEALRTGALSFSKTRAITRVATTANEALLVEMARHATASELERICRGLRQVRALDAAEDRRQHLEVHPLRDEGSDARVAGRRWAPEDSLNRVAPGRSEITTRPRIGPPEVGRVSKSSDSTLNGTLASRASANQRWRHKEASQPAGQATRCGHLKTLPP